ncbi:hypothetical protein DM02DRAFT_659348, partial [Periconia macrospinosa]
MRFGAVLLAFTASIVLGTADIFQDEPAVHLKPKGLDDARRSDVTSNLENSDAVLPRGPHAVEASTDGELAARLIDSKSKNKRASKKKPGKKPPAKPAKPPKP